MAVYEYRCPTCRARLTSTTRGDRLDASCAACGDPGPHVRVFSVAIHRPMMEHFNRTVGKPISSMQQFRDELSRKGAEYTERTGIEVNYQPIDLADQKAVGATDEGLDATRKKKHDAMVAANKLA